MKSVIFSILCNKILSYYWQNVQNYHIKITVLCLRDQSRQVNAMLEIVIFKSLNFQH